MKRPIIIFALLPLCLTACWKTAHGEKVGTVTKLAREGGVVSTWEGQIIRGGLADGSGGFGAPFEFTVSSDELAAKLQAAMSEQREVKITYHREAYVAAWRSEGNGGYFVDDVITLERTCAP